MWKLQGRTYPQILLLFSFYIIRIGIKKAWLSCARFEFAQNGRTIRSWEKQRWKYWFCVPEARFPIGQRVGFRCKWLFGKTFCLCRAYGASEACLSESLCRKTTCFAVGHFKWTWQSILCLQNRRRGSAHYTHSTKPLRGGSLHRHMNRLSNRSQIR